jgi:DNA-binding NarL/FixJ family response regulator
MIGQHDQLDLAILACASRGRSSRQIAVEVGLGQVQVSRRLRRLRRRWGCATTTAAVVTAIRAGLI